MDNSKQGTFSHLHVHTQYSLLDGAIRIKKMVQRAKEMGMNALAITDHGNMYGVIEFYQAAKEAGIKPIIGCEVYLAPHSRKEAYEIDGVRYYHLILLAKDQTGYKNLVKLVSLANIEGMYYKPRIDKELLRKYSEGIIALSACIAGEIPQAILYKSTERAEQLIKEYIDIFGRENFFLEIQRHGLAEEQKANAILIELAKKYDVGLVATNDAHYLEKKDSEFHDVLLCIQMGKKLNDADRMKFGSDEYYLKSPAEMSELFFDVPEAIENSVKIAQRCNVEFEFGKLHLPLFPLPEGISDREYLKKLCLERLPKRYAEPDAKVKERLSYELDVINKMGYDSYFLIVWDFVNFARQEKIPVGPGRGSAAGSIVAYLLGITDIDPLRYDLLFERFLNPERVTMPDIDIDFCCIRREEVIDYVKRRYGDDHVAQIVTFGTMAARGAIRDVGRVLDMPYNDVDRVAKLIPTELGMTLEKALKGSQELKNAYEDDLEVRRLIDFARDIEGMPRHCSTHAAGVVIARHPLTDYVPVQMSEGTLVTEYDKDYVEKLGLLKMDFLGLRTLTIIADALKNIEANRHVTIKLDEIPLEDDMTSQMLCAGDTCGVFQMESGGMTALVKDLQPKGFSDLIPLMALYRPGPLGSGMVDDFISGRNGKKKVTYMHPLLEPILEETFGVVLYQEQVMQIVQVLAGFSLGQADILRRAMGKKKHDILVAQRENFLKGTDAKKIDRALAEKIFDLLVNFADYGFNKSHSAAYALVAYQTAYLKAHYPQEYMAALLTSLMGNSDKIKSYIEQCRYAGIRILPPDINQSGASFTADVVQNGIRFGLAAIKNVGEEAMRSIIETRQKGGKFKSFSDFCRRADAKVVNKRVLEFLIKSGAFDTFGGRRSQYLAVIDMAVAQAASYKNDLASGQMSLFGGQPAFADIELPPLEEIPLREKLALEKEITGFYITGHPLDAYKEKIACFKSITALKEANLPDDTPVRLAGIISDVKRMTTRKGEPMCIVQIEDFAQSMEVVVFPRAFYEASRHLLNEVPVVVSGRINTTERGSKVIARKIMRLDEYKPTYWIKVSALNESASKIEELRALLQKRHGDYPVCFYFLGQNRKIRAERAYWIDGSPETVAAIEALLGKDTIKTA